MKKLVNTVKDMFLASVESTKFCFRYAPLRYITLVLCEILFSILPFVVLYNWQNIINTLSVSGVNRRVWLMVGFYIMIKILLLFVNTFNGFIDKMSYETIDNKRQSMIIEKLSSLDVGKFYDPKFQNAMSVVDNSPGYPYVFNDILTFIKSLVIASLAIGGVWGRYPIPAIAIVLFYIPTLIINCRNAITEYKLYRSEETKQRRSNYYRDILTGRTTAAELRLYGFEDLFLGRYKNIWKQLYSSHVKLKEKQTGKEIIGQLINSLGLVTLLCYIIFDIKTGSISTGDVALYIGLMMTLMASVEDTCFAFSCFYRDYVQCAGKFESFMKLESSIEEKGTKTFNGIPDIEFRNVSFKYPGSNDNVLTNISFKLKKGEKLAVVGINGAGKTTLTKLLCRFYDPTEGVILYDGIPGKEYDINALRGLYGVLFQNNQMYKTSLRDNIMMSDIENFDEERFKRACDISGVEKIAEKLPRGYDTILLRLYGDDNYEPSGGERQKISLARAFYKDAAIVILDEPTSALDAEAEDHVFRKFTQLCTNRSAVLISHRLSAVVMADMIVLIEDGRLIEYGSHNHLMNKNKRYAELFNMQANAYREVIENE